MLTKSRFIRKSIVAPDSLEAIDSSESEFIYRGVRFRVEPFGYRIWGSEGFEKILPLEEKSRLLRDREESEDVLVGRYDNWLSLSKKKTLRNICQSIDEEICAVEEADKLWLRSESEGVF